MNCCSENLVQRFGLFDPEAWSLRHAKKWWDFSVLALAVLLEQIACILDASDAFLEDHGRSR